MRVLSVLGTRPEAIKMAPVILELAKHPGRIDSLVCVTAQHRQMLDQVLGLFDIRPDFDLDLMEENQTLASLTAKVLMGVTEVLKQSKPDLLLVLADPTTAFVAALAGFYQKIPIGHVEAGLRTYNIYQPFPEEVNRHLISVMASYHFAPTAVAAETLRKEGVPEATIFVTGNTVIDALYLTLARPNPVGLDALIPGYGSARQKGQRIILVTAHRRESFGPPLARMCAALRELVERNPQVHMVYPVHMNPNVREPVYRLLGGHERISLIQPLDYNGFVHLMAEAHLILTDSGGIQEEATALGKPTLVMREVTERPEAVQAGTVKVVGTDPERIVAEAERLLKDQEAYRQMAQPSKVFGDGHAAERIVTFLLGLNRG
jgi:UDP-N-acetylglucosamine 2-epimerase (non-hydrolysing)